MLWIITTAGSNRAGICYEVRGFVKKVLDKTAIDESQFGIIYGLDDGDDWTTEEALLKANPNWGVSVMPEVLLPLQAKAMSMPSAANNFRTCAHGKPALILAYL
jgi:phage terminase large subunit-like protein